MNIEKKIVDSIVDSVCNSVYGPVYTNVLDSASTDVRNSGWFSVYSAVWNPLNDIVSSEITKYEY
jgi:hypothetical protein